MEIRGVGAGLELNDNQPRPLRVEVYDADGSKIEDAKLKFSSIAPRIAMVTSDGIVIPGEDGRTRISVRSGFVERELPVHVRIHSTVEVVPNVLYLCAGEVRALSARVLDRQKRTINNARVTWAVADSTIGWIDEYGALSGVSPGNTTLTVRSKGASAELPVEVCGTNEDAS
jgi:hypothetical protein